MKSPGEKSNTPPFFTILGPDFVARKYPFTGDFGNTHAVPPTPEWGGGGPGLTAPYNYASGVVPFQAEPLLTWSAASPTSSNTLLEMLHILYSSYSRPIRREFVECMRHKRF